MHIGYNARMTGWLLLTSVLTLGFCLLASGYVSQTVAEMQNSLVQVENALQAEDWPGLQQALSQSQQKWQKARPYWLGLMNHQDVINIDLALQSIQAYGQEQQRDEVQNQLALLDYYLQLAVDCDKLNWSNLF